MNNYLFKSCESRRRWYREGTGSCVVARPKVIVQQNNKKLIISSASLNIQRRHCVVRNSMHCCAFADAFYCISGVVKCILAGDRVSAQRQSRRTVTLFVTAEIKRVNCPNILLFWKKKKKLKVYLRAALCRNVNTHSVVLFGFLHFPQHLTNNRSLLIS